MKLNHFICSANLELLSNEDHNIFLSNYDFLKIAKEKNNLSYIIANNFQFEDDFKETTEQYLFKLEKILFKKFFSILNIENNKNYNECEWKIILGHWFRKFIYITFNRFFTARHICLEHNINSYISFYQSLNNVISKDSSDFIQKGEDDHFNNYLYLEAI